MTDDSIILEGKLEDIALPTLMMSLYHQRETGMLILSSLSVNKRLYLEEGKIIYADSDDPDDSLGNWFFRQGTISLKQFLKARDSVTLLGSWSRALMELHVVGPENLVDGLTKQLYENIYSLFGINSAIYTLNLTPYSTMDMVTLSAEIPVVVYEGMKRLNAWSKMNPMVGGPEEYLSQVKELPSFCARLDMTSDEAHVLDLCRSGMTTANILDASYLTPFKTYRLLWIFLTLGLIEHQEKGNVSDEAPSAAELIELVERYNEITSFIRHVLDTLPEIEKLFHRILEELAPTYSDLTEGQQELELHGTLDPEAILLALRNIPEKDRLSLLRNFLEEVLYAIVHISQTSAPEQIHRKVMDGVKRKSAMLINGDS